MRVVLHTFGSFGDVHPYMALALELHKRGHDAVVATSEVYREKITAAGLSFAPVRPDVGELLARPDLIEKLWHRRTGPEFLFRHYLLPVLNESFSDLVLACEGAGLFLSHSAGFAGPVVAEMMGIRWLSVALQPMVLFSAYDPPLIGGIPALDPLLRASSGMRRLLFHLGKTMTAHWANPIHALRKRAGLPALKANPLLEGEFSPYGTLALFSPHFGAPQPDWPPHTHATGFPFYDELEEESPALRRFLDDGPAPILFTLGSSAVMQPGSFYDESLKALGLDNFRAILLTGSSADQAGQAAPNVHIADYIPYASVMPRCAAVVHQGGIGTTAQVLRAGKPMIVVPWSYDQPDNAGRVRKLGVGKTLSRSTYSANRLAKARREILDPARGYGQRAADMGEKIRAETGVATACDVIERCMQRSDAA